MNAVAYVRVSTDEQDPENQRLHLEKFAKERGLNIVKWYVDAGVSGAVTPWERPAFSNLVKDLESKTVDAQILLVYEVSRLVRNFNELFALLDLVEGKLGLLVISASEKETALQNLDGIYRQFLRAVLAFVSTLEREFIRQRTKIAMEKARRDGKITNVVEKHIDKTEEIVEMYRKGEPIYAIAKKIGLSRYAVRRILVNTGVYEVSSEVCPRCFSKMKTVEKNMRTTKGKITIVEKLYCKNCGYEFEKII